MSPPGVWTSTGHGNRVAVVLDQKDDRQPLRVHAVFSDSQNSPSLVVPSPSETYTTSSP